MVQVDATGKTVFRFIHATTASVFLVGDFCHWQPDHLPMRQVAPHEWVLMLRLPPGTYEFRYYSGGEWFTDYAAFGATRNRFGGLNAVLRIPKSRSSAARPARIRKVATRHLARIA